MKSMLALAAAALFVGSMAVAADKADEKASEKTTHNPITGTTTTTKEYKDSAKDPSGNSHDVTAKETTKKTKSGKVKKETKVNADETSGK